MYYRNHCQASLYARGLERKKSSSPTPRIDSFVLKAEVEEQIQTFSFTTHSSLPPTAGIKNI